jgi:two-component system response regulator FixJ
MELLAQKPQPAGACAIVDLRMPGMDGLTLLERLKASGADFPVIVATGHGDVPLAVRAMKIGAADFIEKPYNNETLLSIIKDAIGRQARPAQTTAQQAAVGLIESLTPRERDVLEGLVAGDPNKIIAYKLGISPRTVEIHRANLVKKTGAGSLSQLIRLALSAGIGHQDPEGPK